MADVNRINVSGSVYFVEDVNDKLATAPDFSVSSTYAVGSYVYYNNGLYRCVQAVTTAGAWNASDWAATTIAQELHRKQGTLICTDDGAGNITIQ